MPLRSVNDRVDDSKLTPARFGRAMSRLLHAVSFLRHLFPKETLLLTKVDCKSSYRRINLQATTAVKSCTCIAGMLLMALRMTFGGKPNPSQWSDVSEVIADLRDWDATVWRAPQQYLLETDRAVDNNKVFIRPAEPMKPTYPLSTNTSYRDGHPAYDCYLDDLFGVCREPRVTSSGSGDNFGAPPSGETRRRRRVIPS
jgi:hypothetical protein